MRRNESIVKSTLVTALARDVLHRLRQVRQIRLIQAASHLIWHESLHENVTECVQALRDEGIDRRQIWPDIVGAVDSWKGGLAKFGARLIDASEYHLVHPLLMRRYCCGDAGHECRGKECDQLHAV